ncbi:UNVERIFIED_CONTAM: hypothetical protein Scaly_0990900 [Sesamum calycinum]|uniref:Reverse transcriptase domain-containing protein n=1 Tax=Sesamum calycinum TaxID=2727403 RepID=A0AAW2QZ31_9LAMI
MVISRGNGAKGGEKMADVYGFHGVKQSVPKDPYPLSQTDLLVDFTIGATYQRLVNWMFKDLSGKTIKVYVDDMLIKSKKQEDHLSHLQVAFEVMRRYESSPKTVKDVQKLIGEQEEQRREERWMLHVNGSLTLIVGGAGILLQGLRGVKIEVVAKLNFPTTNNEAEYEGLTIGLRMVLDAGVK